MKSFYKYLITLVIIGMLIIPDSSLYAGNKDRSGQAGATELLINPWARSSGWGNVSTANVNGLESMFINVAGLAFTNRTELVFSHTTYLKGTDISMFAFGFSQRIGDAGVIGLNVVSMNFGEIEVTTPNSPEGGRGVYKPNLMNISIAYAKAFSNSIYGGITVKIISESIADANAQGIAIDAGIQYVSGEMDQIKFGISLKNIGPRMKFSGDGLLQTAFLAEQENAFSMNMPSESFELPTALDIGAAYDFYIGDWNRITVAINFRSNSFGKDQFIGGLEYALKTYLMLRVGYTYEDGITKKADRTNVFTGPSAGLTVSIPTNKEKGSSIDIDYSYRATDPFSGTHSIGARVVF
ncbi:MAG: PorV/PorQ family protein [Bacteroidales bacterium]|nr:PorV/PorQ family protein [Bacteroidales bacterium]